MNLTMSGYHPPSAKQDLIRQLPSFLTIKGSWTMKHFGLLGVQSFYICVTLPSEVCVGFSYKQINATGIHKSNLFLHNLHNCCTA